MVTEALKSAQITTMDAINPRTKAHARLTGDEMRIKKATVATVLSASGVGSTYRMVRIPQNAMVKAVFISSDDLGDTGDTDVGIYLPFGGVVVDADHFASATDINAAAVYRRDVTHESGNYALTDVEKPLWEALGETEGSSPHGYDLTLTLTQITTAAGDISVEVWYTL